MTATGTARGRWWRRTTLSGVGAMLIVTVALPAGAQMCTGDCRGLGRVAISDLILAVNIVLGLAPLDQCPAIGPAPVTVARLIAAVNSALCDCRTCPTPLPTRTFTATPPSTATPSASPTPTALVSKWREDNLRVPMSNCPRQLTEQIRQGLAGTVTDYTVRQSDGEAELADDGGNVLPATIDADGTLHASETQTESQGACVVTVDLALTVNLSHSPAAASYAVTVSSAGCPTQVHCRLQVTARWTRIEAALGARDTSRIGRRSVGAVLATTTLAATTR